MGAAPDFLDRIGTESGISMTSVRIGEEGGEGGWVDVEVVLAWEERAEGAVLEGFAEGFAIFVEFFVSCCKKLALFCMFCSLGGACTRKRKRKGGESGR